jgi:hypothetical protein
MLCKQERLRQGLLWCRCRAKIGAWNWAGLQSPTGAWVTPAFCLHQAKIDKSLPVLPSSVAPSGLKTDVACRTAWFTHLIFDCDGVLVDSERASCEALRRSILAVTGVQGLTLCVRFKLLLSPCHILHIFKLVMLLSVLSMIF